MNVGNRPGLRARKPMIALSLIVMLSAVGTGLGVAATDPDPGSTAADAAAGAAVSPMAKAKASGKPVEMPEHRTESSEMYANPSGTVTVTTHMTPVRTRLGDKWVAIDTDLRFLDDRVAPKATAAGLELSDGGNGPLVRLNDGQHVMQLSWPGKLPKPALDGPTATYPEVLPGVDLQVTAQADGFSQLLVVKNAKAAKNPKLRKVAFNLSSDDLKVTGDEKRGLKAVDAKGKAVFSAPPPQMWDSAKGEKKKQAVMKTEVTGKSLAVLPNPKLLTGPGVTYPVYVDPTFTLGTSNYTSVDKLFPNATAGWNNRDDIDLSIGARFYNNVPNGNRGFLQMDVPNLAPGRVVTKASLSFKDQSFGTCSSIPLEVWHTGHISSATSWNNQPTWNTKIATYNCTSEIITVDVRSVVQAVAQTGSSLVDFGFRTTAAVEESRRTDWRWVEAPTATLSVEYAYNGQCFLVDRVSYQDPDGSAFTKEMNCTSQASETRIEPYKTSQTTGQIVAGPHGFVCWRSGDMNAAGNRIWYYVKGDSASGWTKWGGWGYVPADKIPGAGSEPYPGLPACNVYEVTPGVVPPQDFNSDGLFDVLALQSDGNLVLHPGNGNGTLGTRRMLWTDGRANGYKSIFTGDFNADGKTDVAGFDADGTWPDHVIWWWPGDGNGGVGERQPLMDNRYKTQAYLNPGLHEVCRFAFSADFNGDGKTDIMAGCGQGSEQGNYADDSLWWWPGDGDGGINSKINGSLGFEYAAVSRTQTKVSPLDITGDGRMDISEMFSATSLHLKSGPGALNANYGTGTLTSWPPNGFGRVTKVFAGDFNGDRRGDMAGVDAAGQLWWWPGNGSGAFGTPSKMAAATDWGSTKDIL
ncbi:FG-GAP-like repeat-containing protein [Streptomyces liangshanensis]|uniref:VCBS repeat-containing protein n=1 Tax=Streptomyces liangshanensis TaxID=2717324 RepID=A0A6G9H0I4_9ACTN|nr:FG-GAP-like repeat-containing protein [Streptomyces liangshanensis]QIQ04038.1 VCBS repeat-containing protein [Streptomyces liangshanensis]